MYETSQPGARHTSAAGAATVPHGGNLAAAVARFGGLARDWIDLSTGINPHGYPVPGIAAQAWLRLPEEQDGLADLAAAHYGAPAALAGAGSQPVIRALPWLLPRQGHAPTQTGDAVGVATLTYGEYAPAFSRAGHQLLRYGTPQASAAADFMLSEHTPLPPQLLHLVVVNPNNPTGERFAPATLLAWHAQLAARGGTLIVDEAFMDITPDASVAAYSGLPGLVVLRSIGKFFGLAGARAGFTLAHPTLLAALAAELGPWTVSGPARSVVRAALGDTSWQAASRVHLAAAGLRLRALMLQHGLAAQGTPLFAWAPHPGAAAIQHRLAQAAIWVRLFEHTGDGACPGRPVMQRTAAPLMPSLRLGLPGTPLEWQRLDRALADCSDLLAAAPRPAHPG